MYEIKSCFKKIFEAMVTLNNEHKIVVLMTYQSKTGQLVFGSNHVKQKMKQDDDDIVDAVHAGSTIVAKLPCKLELMNYRQCSDWIRNQILANHVKQGKSGTKIVYGDEDWHPDFCLDELFPWSEMNCDFNNFKTNKYYGERNFVWFMKEVILKRLEQKGVQK